MIEVQTRKNLLFLCLIVGYCYFNVHSHLHVRPTTYGNSKPPLRKPRRSRRNEAHNASRDGGSERRTARSNIVCELDLTELQEDIVDLDGDATLPPRTRNEEMYGVQRRTPSEKAHTGPIATSSTSAHIYIETAGKQK